MLTSGEIKPAGYTRRAQKQAQLRDRIVQVRRASHACEWSPSWTFELKLTIDEVLADLHHGRD